MKTTQGLPVIFRAERSGPERGAITAVFPTLAADYAGQEFTVYSSIGQHGAGRLEWYASTRAARPDEFRDLLQELRGIYECRPAMRPDLYGPPQELIVRQRYARAYWQALQADARQARAALQADPRGGPWSPDAHQATAAAMAADEWESDHAH